MKFGFFKHFVKTLCYILQSCEHVQRTRYGHSKLCCTKTWTFSWLGFPRYVLKQLLLLLLELIQQILFLSVFSAYFVFLGVLLLNACLTVVAHKANSHQGKVLRIF